MARTGRRASHTGQKLGDLRADVSITGNFCGLGRAALLAPAGSTGSAPPPHPGDSAAAPAEGPALAPARGRLRADKQPKCPAASSSIRPTCLPPVAPAGQSAPAASLPRPIFAGAEVSRVCVESFAPSRNRGRQLRPVSVQGGGRPAPIWGAKNGKLGHLIAEAPTFLEKYALN